MHWEIEIWTCPDFYFYIENKKSGRVQIFNFSLRKKNRTCPDFDFSLKNKNIWRSMIFYKVFDQKIFDQFFWPEFFWPKFCWNFFCPIFLFLKEEFKSGQVQIFFSQREFKNLDMSGFIFFKAKKKIWTLLQITHLMMGESRFEIFN